MLLKQIGSTSNDSSSNHHKRKSDYNLPSRYSFIDDKPYENKRDRDTTAGLLQVPCAVLPKPNKIKSRNEKEIEDDDLDCPEYLTLGAMDEELEELIKKESKSLTAFIDTGAQVTVMPFSTARRLRLTHFIDRRFAGQATGVGTVKIIGKIPRLVILLGYHQDYDGNKTNGIVQICKDVTILGIEERQRNTNNGTTNVDLLIGLDVLKELDSCIDIREGILRVSLSCPNNAIINKSSSRSKLDNDDCNKAMDVVIPFVSKSKGRDSTKLLTSNLINNSNHRKERNDNIRYGKLSKKRSNRIWHEFDSVEEYYNDMDPEGSDDDDDDDDDDDVQYKGVDLSGV